MSSVVLCTVRDRRRQAGLTQAQLAQRAGVSRQALSAIEAGRQVPSTALALLLAQALSCSVDDLFQLAAGPVVHAELAAPPGASGRVLVGIVAGRPVAHPVHSPGEPADGRVSAGSAAGDVVPVELFAPAGPQLDQTLLVAGCAPLIGLLAARVSHRGLRVRWVRANSTRSLELLAAQQVHVAGMHLAAADDPAFHVQEAQRALPSQGSHLVHLARWRQGLVVATGNPRGVAADALARPDLRVIARDPGAGAQRLLERVRAAAGAAPLSADTPRARTHAEVARLVRFGMADLGVAIESAAVDEGLDFLPLAEERFDLIVPAPLQGEPAVERLLAGLSLPAFRTEAAALPGYDLAEAGHTIAVAEVA